MQKVMQAYFNTKATTTSPGDVIIMLYDGAISFLERAKQKIIEKDYAQKGVLISKAIDVISELDNSLNIEKGGTLAENLHGLYFFCNTQLFQANLKMDISKIDKVISILSNLKSAFAEVVNNPEAVQAAQSNTMTQRAQAPQLRTSVTSSPHPSNIGSARATSMYAKSSRDFTPDTAGSIHPRPNGLIMQPASTAMNTVTETPEPQAPPSPHILTASCQTESANLSLTHAGAEQKQQTDTADGILSPAEQVNAVSGNNTCETTPMPTPQPKTESRFQGAALYKKFLHD